MLFGRTFGLITQRSQVQILTPLPLARPREVYPHAAFLRSLVFFSPLLLPPIPACSTENGARTPPETARAVVAPGWGSFPHANQSGHLPFDSSIAVPAEHDRQVTEILAVELPDFSDSRAMGTFVCAADSLPIGRSHGVPDLWARRASSSSSLPQMKKASASTEALFCFHHPIARKEDYAP